MRPSLVRSRTTRRIVEATCLHLGCGFTRSFDTRKEKGVRPTDLLPTGFKMALSEHVTETGHSIEMRRILTTVVERKK